MEIIDPIIDKKIKYELNYIKKNIDLNKFIKYLQNDLLWDRQSELSIIDYAIRSCLHNKNKDPNIINYKKKFNSSFESLEDFLVLNCFYADKNHFHSPASFVSSSISSIAW